MRSAGAAAQGSTAYLNLEPGDSHADMASVSALAGCGVSRVVIGLLHPLLHLRGQAVRALRAAGVAVSVLEPGCAAAQSQAGQRCLQACMLVNEVRTCLQRRLLAALQSQLGKGPVRLVPRGCSLWRAGWNNVCSAEGPSRWTLEAIGWSCRDDARQNGAQSSLSACSVLLHASVLCRRCSTELPLGGRCRCSSTR